MAEKILKTRIQLRYDTLTNWEANNPVLKAGEIAVVSIPAAPTKDVNSVPAPQILFKVGDGATTFKLLKWASGLAADVYDWAKASSPQAIIDAAREGLIGADSVVKSLNGLKGDVVIDNTDGKITITKDVDKKTLTLKLSLSEAEAAAIASGITAAKVKTYDGYATKISTLEEKPGLDKTGTVTGVKMNSATKTPTDGVVDLGTVLTDASQFDTAGAAAAVLGKSTDAATVATVYGVKKAAANAQSTIDSYKTSNDTALAAVKATADAAQTSTQVDTKISTHNTSATAHSDIRQSITALAEKVSGRATGYVFKNKTDAAYTTAIGKTGSFVVGDTIYFTDTNISDQWVTAVNSTSPYYTFQDIETEKTNLTGYVKGTGLTADKIILGNAGSNIKTSTYGISKSVAANDNANVPTSGAVSTELSKKQNTLNQNQLDAANSGITAAKVEAYDGYATTIGDKQDALSPDQLKAVNSGITNALVTKYDGYETTIDGKQDKITSTNKLAASLVSGLATVATSGSYNDLTNKPSINNAALKDKSGQTIFTANASEDVTITVINCGTSADTW